MGLSSKDNGMVTEPSRFYLEQLFICFVQCLEIGEEEMVVIIVNPEEGEDSCIVGGIKVAVGINIRNDDTR